MTAELHIPDGWYLRDGEPRATWFWIVGTLIACNRPIRILGPLCSSHGCATLAEWRVWWPGQVDTAKCDVHAQGAAHVADALGFVLATQRIDVPPEVRLMMIADHRAVIAREAAEREAALHDDTDRRFSLMELD